MGLQSTHEMGSEMEKKERQEEALSHPARDVSTSHAPNPPYKCDM